MGGIGRPGCSGIAYVEPANFRKTNLPSGVQIMSGGFGSVPWGGEQLGQMSVGAPPPAGNAYNAPHAVESCAATHRPSGETLNAKRFDVGTIFCSSPLSSL